MDFQINPTSLKGAGFGFNRYELLVPAGTPYSALLIPEFWTNVGARLRRFDVVRVVADDGMFDAELSVDNDPRAAEGVAPVVFMRELRVWERGEDDAQPEVPEDMGGFTVGWGGPIHKHRVVDPAGNVVAKGMTSKAEADAWRAAHLAQRLKQAA